jgi:periplasmic divalent cation tolerance protein
LSTRDPGIDVSAPHPRPATDVARGREGARPNRPPHGVGRHAHQLGRSRRTGPTGDLVPDLAREIVTARLAASANVWNGPVQATYWWHGKIQTATETRVHLLTRSELVDRLVSFIRERHPYDVPNISAIPITAGNGDFIDWVKNETRARSTAA